MNKQLEDIQFFTDNLGVSSSPVVNFDGSGLPGMIALTGLWSQVELELCAQFLNGQIVTFEHTGGGKYMMLKEHNQGKKTECSTAGTKVQLNGITRGILVSLQVMPLQQAG